MKIWVIGRGYPTNANRHWGSFELEQAKLLACSGHEVCYLALTLSFFSRKDPRGFRHFREDGVEIYADSRLYFPGKLGIRAGWYEDYYWASLMNHAREDYGLPDVIHVHYPSMISSIRVMEDYRMQGVRLFVTEHWSRVLINKLHRFERKRLEYYAKFANCFASVSEPLLDAVKTLVTVTVPTEVIPNIVSPIFFIQPEKQNAEEFVFITVGRLVPLKQFDQVVEQFRRVFAPEEPIRLKLIGPGSEHSRLECLASGDSRISFLGSISIERVAEEVAQANALVSFSEYETFGVPVAEAWACGKPTIVSDTSGIAAYMTDTLGETVAHNEPNQLGEAMRRMVLNRNAYQPKEISGAAAQHFSSETILNHLEAMYTRYGKGT